ncbi:geranylgeranylglyceryl/heptaprenylglyceryl phosphate synthase [Membranihabitans maritimus]|uniref:geranylgeranylglyceryl/heptaprenylglyceryl phosphate synthase n=1 Tax=Membranihabitans maritimus TaxID=2904244 RepID=UPI001F02B651|nr:geranylgeranylglyceryl/heptaprenylglyceryl phosphate synthase [Membranihabitans maritimus]
MILEKLIKSRQSQKKSFAILLDPDKLNPKSLELLVSKAKDYPVDFFFLGGSLVMKNNIELCLKIIKATTDIPVILFPGDTYQAHPDADGILFLSLISGRNPDLLIGKQVIAAPYLKKSKLEVLPTGYILVDGGKTTTVHYISQTLPIPRDKPEIAACTALAGTYLGLKLIYLDAGSGAKNSIPPGMVRKVREEIDAPIIVGGGIRSGDEAFKLCEAGADTIVVGNAIEGDYDVIEDISLKIQSYNKINTYL